MKSITILGRRWKNKRKGHTYHTIVILVDGKQIFKSTPAYGGRDQYLTSAEIVLGDMGLFGFPEEALGAHCKRNGIEFYADVADVACRKDL